ncbi:TPA: RNA methyltransferase [Corynebacterium striatum]|nr:RNA methyltransferase [Corynebacterium striatum]HAT6634033.1 RNA methyltransferase [Corynebacterium striatum]
MKSAASESVGESEQEVLVSRAGYLPGKARVTNVTRTVQEFQQAGYQVVGLDAGGEHTLDTYTGGKDPVVIVIGSEGKGISRLVRENCDVIMSIPMTAWVESLNASVAAGAVLSEFARQRRAAK